MININILGKLKYKHDFVKLIESAHNYSESSLCTVHGRTF